MTTRTVLRHGRAALWLVLGLVWLILPAPAVHADVRVFQLTDPHPEAIVKTLRNLYGDKIGVDLIQQRLVVVGSGAQLQEIGSLLAQLDRTTQALRLTLSEQPPDQGNGISYRTDRGSLTIDTVAGALVTLERSQFTQQPGGNGWWVTVENVPTEFSSVMLQVQLQSKHSAQVLVSYSREENQQRRVFGNTVSGELGSWLPLLPQTDAEPQKNADAISYSTGPKHGTQLYLRIDPVVTGARTATH